MFYWRHGLYTCVHRTLSNSESGIYYTTTGLVHQEMEVLWTHNSNTIVYELYHNFATIDTE